MPTPEHTRAVLVLAAVLLGAYDLVALGLAGPPATVSRVCLDWAERFPLFPLAVGVLIGHVFSAQRP